MNSLTITAQGVTAGRRHGRSRALRAYHRITAASNGSLIADRSSHAAGTSIARMDRDPAVRSSGGALLRPVGPRPPGVYWARRLVLVAVAVIVVVLLAHACSGGTASPPGGAGPQITPTPTVTTSLKAGPITGCHKQDLEVTAATDAETYPAGSLPRLSAVVRNSSDRACRFRTLPAERVWSIVSGHDQVWTSADCTLSGVVAKTKLRAGHTIAYALVWNRRRSAKGCPAQTPQAAPGTYQLHVSVNGVAAATVVFHLTG